MNGCLEGSGQPQRLTQGYEGIGRTIHTNQNLALGQGAFFLLHDEHIGRYQPGKPGSDLAYQASLNLADSMGAHNDQVIIVGVYIFG